MSEVLVSIIIPAFNAEAFIRDTIRSVLQQSITDLEVIVVDDGSTDGTASVVRSMPDPRIRLISQANTGVSGARNRGIDAARGAYIGFLDADDAMEPGNIAEKVRILSSGPMEWVFSDMLACDHSLEPIGIMRGTDGDLVRTVLIGVDTAVPAACSNIILKRACLDAGTRFEPRLSNAADQHFVLALAAHHGHARIPRPLARYRVLASSMSRNVALYEADHRRLLALADEMGLLQDRRFARTVRANAEWSIGGSWWVNAGARWKGLRHLIKAILMDPGVLMRRLARKRRGPVTTLPLDP